MKATLGYLSVLIFIFSMSGCIEIKQPHSKLPPGIWRAILFPDKIVLGKERVPDKDILDGKVQFETVALGELPFLFEVVYDTPDSFHLVIHNGEERIKVTDITYGLDRRTAKDTLTIEFPIYNTKIVAIYEESVIEGRWIDMNKEDYSIPFAAFHGRDYRFSEMKKDPVADLTGTWQVLFGTDTDKTTPAVGEFVQDGNHITGTFRLETGDYRYLEGTVQENKMYLSTFDGSVAYLFEAKILDDNTLQGVFRSGKHFQTTWEGVRSEESLLKDPLSLTTASAGSVAFTFPDSEGEEYTFEPNGRVTVLQIMGSWCRNCYDESLFLAEQYEAYHDQGLDIVSLAFERKQDTTAAIERLARYKDRLDLPYPVLLAGLSVDKKEASKVLPMIDELRAFPTTIFIDKKGVPRKVYTGIYGPASQKHEEYVAEVKSIIEALLAE